MAPPRLNLESRRSYEPGEAHDGPGRGYSRDPFKRLDPEHQPEVALAIVAYTVRAHSFFFFRRKRERSINAAKVSLNDLFQASRLAVRLYYSLPCCHTKIDSGDQGRYFEAVRQGADLDSEPWCSPYFVWSLLTLVEVQRGNVYRQLGYLEEAHRHYRHVMVRYRQLIGNPYEVGRSKIVPLGSNSSSDHWFVHPTFIRTLSEHSKVLFDRGLFIESIMAQIQALAYLARMSGRRQPLPARAKRKQQLLDDVAQGLALLDVTRKESTCDKQVIRNFFIKPGPFHALLEKSFMEYLLELSPEDRGFAAGLYARIALNLDIFHNRPQRSAIAEPEAIPDAPEDQGSSEETVARCLEVHRRLKLEAPPSIVRDARSMLLPGYEGSEETSPEETLERSLARSLRRSIKSSGRLDGPLDEKDFFESTLVLATHNIQNILTIPRRIHKFLLRPGYKERRTSGDLSGKTVAESMDGEGDGAGQSDDQSDDSGNLKNKLVVLRRWQSFTPKIPRPRASAARGGGYFLLWAGKGVAIDPGYDFLQNFYDEGFSLADIDAVVVTHSHPDHEDDLSTLSTLVREWNEYHHHMGREGQTVKLDLLLNESAHLKFSSWLKASNFGIGRVIPLPLVVWDSDSDEQDQQPRGDNVLIPLRDAYSFDLEVVPAWHDDVIGKTAAVGLKFHLYDPSEDGAQSSDPVGVVGYTGDTAAYSYPKPAMRGTGRTGVADHYQECDVLVAHLGDVRLRELFTCIEKPDGDPKLGKLVGELLERTFCRDGHAVEELLTREAVEDFYSLLVTLHLAPSKALEARLRARQATGKEREEGGDDDPKERAEAQPQGKSVAEALHHFIRKEPLELVEFATLNAARKKLIELGELGELGTITTQALRHLDQAAPAAARSDQELEFWQVVYALLGFLCAASLDWWRYGYHLGIDGLYKILQALAESCREGAGQHCKVLIIGELPEELASHRHHVTRLLNYTEVNFDENRNRKVHALTGDIGLHIALEIDTESTRPLVPKIRCAYCNYNNETVLTLTPPDNYHPPGRILETPLKRLDSAMIYLCTAHDHHPEIETRPRHFLSRPVLRVI